MPPAAISSHETMPPQMLGSYIAGNCHCHQHQPPSLPLPHDPPFLCSSSPHNSLPPQTSSHEKQQAYVQALLQRRQEEWQQRQREQLQQQQLVIVACHQPIVALDMTPRMSFLPAQAPYALVTPAQQTQPRQFPVDVIHGAGDKRELSMVSEFEAPRDEVRWGQEQPVLKRSRLL